MQPTGGKTWHGKAAGEINLVFYADDRSIAGRYREWVHGALAVTVAILFRMGLEANLKKNKAMVCTPRFIWGNWWETAYKRRAMGEAATFR